MEVEERSESSAEESSSEEEKPAEEEEVDEEGRVSSATSILAQRPMRIVHFQSNVRSELRGMSFAELLKLKEELGSKVYNEAMFGGETVGKRKKSQSEFKRENKNRPRETTTKKQVPLHGGTKSKRKEQLNGPRDPRFDNRCGEFDRDKFKQDYEFVNEIRETEAEQLKAQLRSSANEEEKVKIKALLQRMKNQSREAQKLKERKEAKQQHTSKISAAIKTDKKPFFVSKRT